MGLSLWIVPSPTNAARIEGAMKVLQKDSSLSESTYPTFYPHITLASLPSKFSDHVDEVETAIRKSILNKQKVQAPFQCVEIGDHYFRSVYIAIELTPELDTLRNQVHIALGLEKKSPLFPHLSLCYISDEDAARGERKRFYDELTAKRFKRELTRASGGSDPGVTLVSVRITEQGAVEEELDRFEIHEIWLVECEGPVEDWPVLRKISV